MKYGSLFTGIGGFDLALKRAGFEPAWMCEIDKNCKDILNKQFEGVKLYGDIRDIDTAEPVDIIVGGFPCQDLSVAGKRAGLNGERSRLWFEFARIIDLLEPKWVVIENVPGLLSSNGGRDFAIIIQWLAQRGYGVSWRVLDAQYFGVPQRRRRVFIVGSLGNGSSAEVLFEREGSPWDTAPSREKGEEVATTIGASPSTNRSVNVGNGQGNIITTSTLRGFGHGWQGQHNDTNAVMVQNTVGALQVRDCKGIGTTIDDKIVWQMNHASEVYREGANPNISPTLQNRMGTGGNNVPLVGVRRLTPTECERLQGFPDGWTEGQSDTVRYRQLGNAVAVPVVEWIARRITQLNGCADY